MHRQWPLFLVGTAMLVPSYHLQGGLGGGTKVIDVIALRGDPRSQAGQAERQAGVSGTRQSRGPSEEEVDRATNTSLNQRRRARSRGGAACRAARAHAHAHAGVTAERNSTQNTMSTPVLRLFRCPGTCPCVGDDVEEEVWERRGGVSYHLQFLITVISAAASYRGSPASHPPTPPRTDGDGDT